MDGSGRISADAPTLVLNYGDPAWRHAGDRTVGLHPAEEIFLRILAYLLFAESVCIPVRHMLIGDPMAEAVRWSAPLLEVGLLLPARRSDTCSFTDDARMRLGSETALRRAEFLDAHTAHSYCFNPTRMAQANRRILDSDLESSGAFRKVVVGGRSGRYRSALDAARNNHEAHGNGSPDAFIAAVADAEPALRHQARRWAMARYYTTPVLSGVDTVNIREVPASASDLLRRAGALGTPHMLFDGAGAADLTVQRIRCRVPALQIQSNYRRYCDALLEVRQALPQARRVFSEVSSAAELEESCVSLNALLDRELARQMRSRPSKNRGFALVSGLLSSTAGAALGLATGGDLVAGAAVGAAFGVTSNVISNELQGAWNARRQRRTRPWLLAMDRLDASLAR